MGIIKSIWHRVHFWFWWRFIATEHQKVKYDLITKGAAFMKSGKIRIDPNNFLPEGNYYKQPNTDMADALAYSLSSNERIAPTSPKQI